jgi:glutaredoxin
MKIIRLILSFIILLLDRIFVPTSQVRSAQDQAAVDERAAGLVIYQYAACPFCVKVRRFLKGAGVTVQYRDAKSEPFASELLRGGGKMQVPCLRNQNNKSAEWLYESNDIIQYFKTNVLKSL